MYRNLFILCMKNSIFNTTKGPFTWLMSSMHWTIMHWHSDMSELGAGLSVCWLRTNGGVFGGTSRYWIFVWWQKLQFGFSKLKYFCTVRIWRIRRKFIRNILLFKPALSKRHAYALMHTLALIFLWIIWNWWDLNQGWSGVKHRFRLNIPTDTSYWQNREGCVTWTWSIIMNI